jgi:CspA family cold shock protein
MQRRLSEADLPIEPASLNRLTDQQTSSPPPPPKSKPRSQEPERGSSFEMPVDIQIDPQTGKYIGRVKWYNTKKGYGFIMRGGGEEIFFHKSGAVDGPSILDDGQWVLYDVEDTHKGPEATDVEPYEGDMAG